MRHVAVRRVTVLLDTGCVLYTAAFGWLVRDAPPAPTPPAQSITEGSLLFQRHCSACQAVDDLRAHVREGGGNSVETFLRQHGEATDAEDHLIVGYLTVRERRS